MNELIVEDKEIENMIYKIRGQEVMLDSDLARLFEVETKYLNRQVKRNMNRFPEDFMFQLTDEEYELLKFQNETSSLKIDNLSSRCQNVTLNKSGNKRGYNVKYLPYVFTEHGIVTLAGVLKSDIAAEMSVRISRTFVAMRHYLIENGDIYKTLSNINNKIDKQNIKLVEQDSKIDFIFSKLGFNGKLITDSDGINSYLISIFKEAKKELIIIDPYLDDKIFSLLEETDCTIIMITSNKRKISSDKYKVVYDNSFHDRYFIIDRKAVYLCGTSINYIGNKISTIIKMEDKFMINELLNIIDKVC